MWVWTSFRIVSFSLALPTVTKATPPPRSFGGGSKVLELDWSGQESPAQTAEVCPAASLPSKQLFDCLQLLVLN